MVRDTSWSLLETKSARGIAMSDEYSSLYLSSTTSTEPLLCIPLEMPRSRLGSPSRPWVPAV